MDIKKLLLLFFSIQTFFVSGQIDHWETVIYNDDLWSYKLGNQPFPQNWNSPTFNAASWLSGDGGIGYGDDDDNTTIIPVQSLIMRKQFNVTDITKVDAAILHGDYDDAFVAYLNGVEIARNNVWGEPPVYDTWANGGHEAQVYNGGRPEQYNISIEALNSLLQNGNNVLAIQIHNDQGSSSSDMSSSFWLSFGINDTSSDYGDLPEWFLQPVFTSHLPILRINTGGPNIPNDPKIPAEMEIVWNGTGNMNSTQDVANEFTGNIMIEKRGNSSLYLFPKNGYTIETKDEAGEDMDVSFLGFPEEEDWILHGPYSDKTLMRNVLIKKMARSMGQYASRTRYVDLMVNGYYEGIYVLMEKIKRGPDRVDIAKLKEEDIAGDELTGGYIFKVDNGEADWLSPYNIVLSPDRQLPFQYVYPKASKIMPEQAAYLQSFVDSFENAVMSPNHIYGGKRYDEYIDLESFADAFIINEVGKNVDGYRLSTYFHKKKDSNGGKIHAGPVWDFNLAFGNADYCENSQFGEWMYFRHCDVGNPFWWQHMLEDPAFLRIIKCRWDDFRQGPLHVDTLHNFIDETAAFLEPALERNFSRWPVLGQWIWPNPLMLNNYPDEVLWMKNFIGNRMEWLDQNMFGNCSSVSTENLEVNELEVFPNPARNFLKVTLPQSGQSSKTIFIYNSIGQLVNEIAVDSTLKLYEIDLDNFSKGQYTIECILDGKKHIGRFMVL